MKSKSEQPTLFELPKKKGSYEAFKDRRISILERTVFTFNSSKADKAYFKQQIVNWINNEKDFRSLTKLSYDMTWERNDEGRTCKYLYFNERSQRVYLDRDFFEWVKLITGKIEETVYIDDKQLVCDVCGCTDVIEVPHMGKNCNKCHPL